MYYELNSETYSTAEKLKVEQRLERYEEKEAFITIKDHKSQFPRRVECRLLNPSKNQLGKVSKHILDTTIRKLLEKTMLNSWKNTNEVIQWFRNIPDKKKHNFITVDVRAMYPNITRGIVAEALQWASEYDEELDQVKIDAILVSLNSILISCNNAWQKKVQPSSETSLFDVTMGSYAGAEICTLVGIYILQKVSDSNIFCGKWAFGLYRDDFIGVVMRPIREIEHGVKKQLVDIFKIAKLELEGFVIGKKTVFLDVQFDLKKEEHRPYRKPNNNTTYINTRSNHPKSVIRALPKNVEKRISMLSSSEAIFEESKHEYVQALKDAGYSENESNLTYQNHNADPDADNRRMRRKRNRHIIWFTPPWSNQVSTNIGKQFLKIIDESFKNTSLARILNRSTIKISYSVTRNLKSIITGQNKKILNNYERNGNLCSCRDRDKCPLNNNCVQKDIVYKATTSSGANEKEYIGCTDNFKPRYRNHVKSFNNFCYRNDTELSTYVWSQKRLEAPHNSNGQS